MEEVYFLMTETKIDEQPTEKLLVHHTEDPRPYLTKSINGLAATRSQYSLFRYTPGSNIAKYIPDPRRAGNINHDVVLMPDQIELIETAIKENHFFD